MRTRCRTSHTTTPCLGAVTIVHGDSFRSAPEPHDHRADLNECHYFLQLTLNPHFISRTMSASVATAATTTTKPRSHRGGRGGGRGSGGRRGGGPTQQKSQNDPAPTESTDTADAPATPTTTTQTVPEPATVAENTDAASQDDDTVLCLICAEPVKYYSISECNHRTCHICAVRLRALYKRQDCTLCKVRISLMCKNEVELTDDSSSPIGTPTFVDLHDISHRDLYIVQTKRYPL